jgi:hypothetical protein
MEESPGRSGQYPLALCLSDSALGNGPHLAPLKFMATPQAPEKLSKLTPQLQRDVSPRVGRTYLSQIYDDH